ncbi:MAG: NUDIX hydrolase [Mycetocola sp.]
MSAERAIFAAGALCWRTTSKGAIKILLVHRPSHNDISLPKGKVDPGETLPQTAVREIKEETGLSVVLGAPLGINRYTISGDRTKIVHYWAAEVTRAAIRHSDFVPNDEISGLQWVGLRKAKKLLSYGHDVDIVEAFEALIADGITRTFSVTVLRHAKATPPSSWDGPDSTRPLTKRGKEQAELLVPTIQAFGVSRVSASDAVRCQETVAPLALATGVPVKAVNGISQDAYEEGVGDIPALVTKRIRSRRNAVVCSHGPVIPEILRQIALATGSPHGSYLSGAAALDTSAFSVVHISADHPGSGIIAVETYPARV